LGFRSPSRRVRRKCVWSCAIVSLVLCFGSLWEATYNVEVALVVSQISALLAEVAALQMERQLVLAGAMIAALRACQCKRAVFVMPVELGLTRQYALAALALEVVVFEMLGEYGLVWAIEATTRLQAMLVLYTAC
jgi:hypothetical protein